MPPSFQGLTPTARHTMTVAQSTITGRTKLRRSLLSDVDRHGSSGPTPVRNSRKIPIGMATVLYQGAPTVTLLPTTYSERMGKSVPHKMTKQAVSRTRLLNRKLDSRLTSDSR